MLAEISAPRGFDTRLATVGYIVRGLLDDSSPNRHTSQGTANGMAGPVEWCSPDNHTCSFMSHPVIELAGGNGSKARSRRRGAQVAPGRLREGVNRGGLKGPLHKIRV